MNGKLNNIYSLIKTMRYNKLVEDLYLRRFSQHQLITRAPALVQVPACVSWFQPRVVWGIQPSRVASSSLHEEYEIEQLHASNSKLHESTPKPAQHCPSLQVSNQVKHLMLQVINQCSKASKSSSKPPSVANPYGKQASTNPPNVARHQPSIAKSSKYNKGPPRYQPRARAS